MKDKAKDSQLRLGDAINELIFLGQLHFPVGTEEGVWKRNVIPLLKRKQLVIDRINKIVEKLNEHATS